MSDVEPQDRWLWVIDEQLVAALFGNHPEPNRTGAAHNHSAQAVAALEEPARLDAMLWGPSPEMRPDPAHSERQDAEKDEPALREETLPTAAPEPDSPGSKDDAGRHEAAGPENAAPRGAGMDAPGLDAPAQNAKDSGPDNSPTNAPEATPQPAGPSFEHGAALFQAGQYEAALAVYRELAEQRPEAAALYNSALCLRQLGRHGEALRGFETALRLKPNATQASVALGWCLLHLGRAEEALARFDLPLGATLEARQGRAQALQLAGRLADAKAAYQELLAADPENPDILTNLIAIAAEEGDHPNLRHYSENLLRLRNRSRQALAGLVTAELAEGRYDSALHHLGGFLDLDPRSYEAWFNVGLVYQLTGKNDEALKAYRQAIALNEGSFPPHLNLSGLFLLRGDADAAMASLAQALELQPEHPAALWNMALAAGLTGKTDEVQGYYRRLTAADPGNLDAALQIGVHELRGGNWEEAAGRFVQCLKGRENWADAWTLLGVAKWSGKELDAAALCFDKALAREPGSIPALQCRTALALTARDLAKAPELEALLADLGQTTPAFCYNLGVLQYEARQFEAAAHSFRRAVGKRPTFGDALINLGYTLEAMGQHEQAFEALRSALSVEPELPVEYFQPK